MYGTNHDIILRFYSFIKIKTKFVPAHTVKVYGAVEVQLHSFVTGH